MSALFYWHPNEQWFICLQCRRPQFDSWLGKICWRRDRLPTSVFLASLVAQLIKNLPTMQETWVLSLGWEDPLRRERLPTLVFWPGEFHGLYSPWGCKESDRTEWLSFSLSHIPTWLLEIIALTIQTFIGKGIALLFNTLSRFVLTFLPRRKCLLILWLSHHPQWFWSPRK